MKEITKFVVDGDLLKACAWCEKENPQYAQDVKEFTEGFKLRVSHVICNRHEKILNEEIDNLNNCERNNITG